MPARHVYNRFKDVSEMVLTRRPAALTYSYTVLRHSTDGQSLLWDPSWRLSRRQARWQTVVLRQIHGGGVGDLVMSCF